jgi:hypothetical protein
MPERLRTGCVAVALTVGLVLMASACTSQSSGSAAEGVSPSPTCTADENSVVVHVVVDDSRTYQDCDPPSSSPQPSQFGGSARDVCAAVGGSHLDPCWPVLQDDSSCYARTHGALGVPGISYVCGETREWGTIGEIDESTPVWTAPIIRPDAAATWMASGQSDPTSVPTIPEAVKVAYSAGAGSGNRPLPTAPGEAQAADSGSCPDQAALMSGLTTHQNDGIQTIDRIQCDSGFAVASGHTANYAEVLLYQQTADVWIEIDRSAPCDNGEVPSSIEPTACHSG